MKILLTSICIFWLACVQAKGQSTLLDIKVSLHVQNTTVPKLLDEIEQRYNITFSYFDREVLFNLKVSLMVTEEPLYKVLDKVFHNRQIQYQLIGSQVVIKKASPIQKKDTYKSTPLAGLNSFNKNNQPPEKRYWLTSHQLFSDSTPVVKLGVEQTTHDKGKKSVYTTNEPRNTLLKKKYSLNSSISLPTKTGKNTHYSLLNPLPNPLTLQPNPERANIKQSLVDPKVFYLPASEPRGYKQSNFQIALLPGISTHGIHPGEFVNHISLNLLAGYSAGNQKVELGGLSNFNQQHVYGLQIGGIANVVGGNKFVGLSQAEKLKVKKNEDESNLEGVQLAGLTNIIAGNMIGWQTAGGINIVQQSVKGFQLAGISNLVNTYSFGLQVAGVSNVARESVDGVQIAGLYNYTDGELHGIQVGAFNQASLLEGRRSLLSSDHSGLQLGLINQAKRMNGYQIGLLNIGGNMAGTQIGLINIHRNKKGNGTPIGLLNITSKDHFIRLYSSELFMSNLEISTGSANVQNILTFGYNATHYLQASSPKWNVGYSIGKIKKPTSDYFYSYDIGASHVSKNGKLEKELSLLAKIRGVAGYKIHNRYVTFHIFGGLTFNGYFAQGDREDIAPDWLQVHARSSGRHSIGLWPGFVAGIHL